jgi:hypothetical protein
MASIGHLARRFFGAVLARPLTAVERDEVAHELLDGERALFAALTRADQRHGLVVARCVRSRLGPGATRPVMAAALLHDVGKLDSRLGTYGRVVATVCAKVAGRDMAGPWSTGTGFTRRVGLYLRHDELGAQRLTLAGSDALTVAWAREHHQAAEAWTVPMAVAEALKAADDD